MRVVGKWAILCFAAWPLPVFAQDKEGFDLSGTIRLRYESITDQPRVGFNQNDNLVNLRTTLLAKYQTGPFTIAGELWDSRVYGGNDGTPVTTGEVNTFELVQAYVAAKGTIGRAKISAQAGRFTLNLGSRRLIAADDYRNTTNGYTGLRADLAMANNITATAIYVLPQQRRPDDAVPLRDNAVGFDHEGFDLVLWGGTVAKAKALGPVTAEASFYHLGERDTPGRATRDRSLDTYGGRLIREPATGEADGRSAILQTNLETNGNGAGSAYTFPLARAFIIYSHLQQFSRVELRWVCKV